jgi:diguanylate cyclase (GGDEF)-like protein
MPNLEINGTRSEPATAKPVFEFVKERLLSAQPRRHAALNGNRGVPLQATSATWIALGIALGAAGLAVALAIILIVVLMRARKPGREEVRKLVDESLAGAEARLSELSLALDQAHQEGHRARAFSEIGATIDLDTVLTRTLEAAGALPGIDCALVVLLSTGESNDAEPLVATIGMSVEEAASQPMGGPPDGRPARAMRVAYTYTQEEADEDGEPIRGGLAVPLRNEEGEPVGTLAVFWRGAEREPSDEEVSLLEELAASAGPSLANARRFREARQLADLDALTNLHNRRYFHETLARECARAHRYDRRLALVVFDVDDFKAINDRIGHLAGDSVLAAVAERVQSVVRSADVACRVGGDEFGVILPESTLNDAEQLYSRVQFAVAARPIGPFDRIHLSAGIAELAREDSSESFFQRADQALYRAKEAGKGRVVAANGRR